LTAYPKGKPQKWFERLFDSKTQDYIWKIGENFKGELSSWRALTRSNALFLTTAVQFNSKQLQPVFHWIDKNLIVIFPGIDFNRLLTLNMFDDEQNRVRLLNFMQVADLGIEDFQVRKEETNIGLQTSTRLYKISALHKVADSSELISLDLDQESMGTQKLFWLAGGWIKALQEGAVLLYDELSSSFHPHISRFLINQFHAPHTNQKNAQLIISTHDTNLLDENIFRRDQIWFTEKNHDEQSTYLYSLWEYSPRKGEAFEKGYLKGRYGALPLIGVPEL
jgi:AAA15 family ATPase/GTPase